MSIQELPKGLVEATKSVLEGSKEYQAFFKSALKKFGVDSPAELGDKKKEFFNYVDKNYKGKNEDINEKLKKSGKGTIDIDYIGDSNLTKKLEKKFKIKIKQTGQTTADVSGDYKNIISFLKNNYLMDDGEIEDIFSELGEEVKEGKLPPALQKAIDKKKEQEGEKKVDEWISADGDRRRVAEKDNRKVKVEDVVRDMWKNATEV